MMRFLLCTLLSVSALLLPAKGEAGKYYPLEQGRSWTYRVTKTDIEGGETTYEFDRQTIPARMLGDQLVVPFEYSKDGVVTGWFYIVESDAGILWYARQSIHQSAPTLFETYAIRYPVRVGVSWDESMASYLLPVKEKVPYTTTITDMADSVTVPAGRFDNCLKLRMEGAKKIEGGLYWGGTIVIEATDWHCAGIGFTKAVMEQRIEHPIIDFRATKEEELIKYGK